MSVKRYRFLTSQDNFHCSRYKVNGIPFYSKVDSTIIKFKIVLSLNSLKRMIKEHEKIILKRRVFIGI